jgi:hypothetical protein
MRVLAFLKPHKDFRTAARILMQHEIAVSGPYRRHDGQFVFGVAGCVITEEELLCLQREARLSANGVRELIAEIKKRSSILRPH